MSSKIAIPMTVRSFDLFDTLAGRLHYRPDSIFHLVEKEFPFPCFSVFRAAAHRLSNRTLPDIYRKMREWIDMTDAQAAQLMEFELETELSQVFPIMENINLVRDGDLIVSDTYYDTEQIRRILNKIGLNQNVQIYATACGKSSGAIWDVIKKKHVVSSHLGDSLHSDVKMAEAHGIAAVHYSDSSLSRAEQTIMKMGHDALAYLMRAVRLQNPYPSGSAEYLLWNEQCQLNLPILIQSSLYLNGFCQKEGKKRILFTSRDGCLWIQLFQKLYPHYDSIYFHASRATYMIPTSSYIEYVKSIYTKDTVIVDSRGRGRSCEKFFTTHLNVQPVYLAIVNFGKKHYGIVRKRKGCDGIEMLNYDLSGTLYDVQDGKPLRCEPEYDLRFVQPMHACIEKCKEILSHYQIEKFDQRVVDWAVKSMNCRLALSDYIDHARFHFHLRDGGVMRHIHGIQGMWTGLPI